MTLSRERDSKAPRSKTGVKSAIRQYLGSAAPMSVLSILPAGPVQLPPTIFSPALLAGPRPLGRTHFSRVSTPATRGCVSALRVKLVAARTMESASRARIVLKSEGPAGLARTRHRRPDRSAATRTLVECRITPRGSRAANSLGTRRTKCQVPFRRVRKSA